MKKIVEKSIAQGTIEYLVIIGVVIVLSLVVVGLVITQVDNSSNVSSVSSEVAFKVGVGGISLASSVVGVDGNGLLVITNNSGDNLTLTKIIIDGVDHNYSENLVNGDKKSFKLNGITACGISDDTKTYSLQIEYTSYSGLTKVANFQTVPIDCVSVVVPNINPIEETISNVVYPFSGSSLSFNGSTDYVTIPDSSEFYFGGNDFSISYWFYANSYTDSSILIAQNGGNGYTLKWGIKVTSSTIYFTGHNPASTPLDWLTCENTAGTGNWTHHVWVRENDSLKLYVNNELFDSSVVSVNFPDVSNPVFIGYQQGEIASYHWNGKIGKVAMFNRALSENEINLLYDSGRGLNVDEAVPPFNTGLIAGYPFDEGSGTTVYDVSTEHNGTLVGVPDYTEE